MVDARGCWRPGALAGGLAWPLAGGRQRLRPGVHAGGWAGLRTAGGPRWRLFATAGQQAPALPFSGGSS